MALAAASSVAASAAWYSAFSGPLARLDEAYAGGTPPPPWVLPVEFARSATVAAAVSVLADRTGTRDTAGRMRLGLGLWAAFPVVLLTGSVVHEKVPWPQAAIHAGDWLAKLLLVSAVAGRRRAPR